MAENEIDRVLDRLTSDLLKEFYDHFHFPNDVTDNSKVEIVDWVVARTKRVFSDFVTKYNNENHTYKLSARDGQKEMTLTPAQRKEIEKVVEEAKKDDNSDLF